MKTLNSKSSRTSVRHPRRNRSAVGREIGHRIFRRRGARVATRPQAPPHELPARPSPAQVECRIAFNLAVQVARCVLAYPSLRDRYLRAAGGDRRRLFAVAVADALRPPEIRSIDIDSYRTPSTDVVRVDVDDVVVHSVELGLWLRDHTLFASGLAKRVGGAWWFVSPRPVPIGQLGAIVVHAVDLAGNESDAIHRCDLP